MQKCLFHFLVLILPTKKSKYRQFVLRSLFCCVSTLHSLCMLFLESDFISSLELISATRAQGLVFPLKSIISQLEHSCCSRVSESLMSVGSAGKVVRSHSFFPSSPFRMKKYFNCNFLMFRIYSRSLYFMRCILALARSVDTSWMQFAALSYESKQRRKWRAFQF